MNIKEAIESQNASVIELQLRQYLQHKHPEHLTDELLLNLWQWQIENNLVQLECLVLESLALYMDTSKTLSKTITRSYLSQIYTNLSGKHSTVSSTLKLMIAMANYSSRDLALNFNFNLKQFDSILKIRRKSLEEDKMPNDIRNLYIQLVCTLVRKNDSTTRQYLLEIKNFVGALMKDLKNDNPKTVQYVLETMEIIIADEKISRTAKSLLFSNYILEQLVQLYGKESLASIVHPFLLKLCTTVGSGVCFQDAGWYGKLHNFNLSKLILNLKSNDLKQRELLISILGKCPELFSIEPRSSVSYFANISLIVEIINLEIPVNFGYKNRNMEKEEKFTYLDNGIPLPEVHSALQNIYPSILNKIITSKSLQANDSEIRFAISQLLVTCFKKLEKVLSKSSNTEWNSLIIENVRNLLPDVQIVLALFQKEKFTEAKIDGKDLLVSHTHLLYYYQLFNTEQLRKTRFDFTKLLQFDIQSEIFVKLIGNVPDFKWNQSVDIVKKLISLDMLFDNWLAHTILFQKSTINTFKRNLEFFDLDYISNILYKDSRNYKLLDSCAQGVPVIYYALDKTDISCIKFIIEDVIYSGIDLNKINFDGIIQHWIKRMSGEKLVFKKRDSIEELDLEKLIKVNLSAVATSKLNMKPEFLDTLVLIQGSKVADWTTLHSVELLFDQLYIQNESPEIQEQLLKWCGTEKERVIKCGLFYMNAKPNEYSDTVFLDLLYHVADKDCSFILENMVIKQRFLEPNVAKVVLQCLDEQNYGFYKTLFINDLHDFKPVHLEILQSGLFDAEIPRLLKLNLHDSLFRYCVQNLNTSDLDFLFSILKQCIKAKIKLAPIFKNSLLVSKLESKQIKKLLKNEDYEYIGWVLKSFIFHWPIVLEWIAENDINDRQFLSNIGSVLVDFENYSILEDIPKFVLKSFKKLCKSFVESSLWELNEQLLQILHIVLGDKVHKVVNKGLKEIKGEKQDLEKLNVFNDLLYSIDRILVEKDNLAMTILAFIKSILVERKKKMAVTKTDFEQESILSGLIEYIIHQDYSLVNIESELIDSVVLQCIKYRLTDPKVLKLVVYLLPKTKIAKLDVMITTHSAYDSIITSSEILTNRVIPENHPAKPMLLTLLYDIMLQTKRLSIDYLPKIMANYHGTMSESDLCALKIIMGYEQLQDTSITNYIGQFAKKEVTQDFIPAFETLNAIDIPWMTHSLNWFPIDRDILQVDYMQRNAFSSGISPIYDPAFFLMLFLNILQQPEHADLHLLLETNVVGMAVMGLSSTSLNTRKLCHHLTFTFYDLLLESEIKERNQTLLVLSTFRNAVNPTTEDPYPRVPQMIASFVAQSLAIMLKPESELYPQINRFCLQRPIIDLTDVPMFYQMFYSQSTENRKDRHWILKLLLHGISTKSDFQLLKRRFVLDIVESFFVSPMADMYSKQLVFQIIFKLCDIPSAVSTLITKQGILGYLKGICSTIPLNTPNKLFLALPVLLIRLFKTYIDTPTKWDGKTDRIFFIEAFVDTIDVLITRLKELKNTHASFASSSLARIISLCNELAAYCTGCSNGIKFHSVTLMQLYTAIETLDNEELKPIVFFENDIDQLFTETFESKKNLLNQFRQLLCNTRPHPLHEVDDTNFVKLVEWSLKQNNDVPEQSFDPKVVERIKGMIQYTPTPKYLLNGGMMNEMFKSAELGHLLKVCWSGSATTVDDWFAKVTI
ncbi:nucleolar pre-ribosomal-associated protein 1 [Boothiomyces sp. JEL0838]|nr:nucleolar pre-ribosomal-associated protein 1 [Boothiomyces sp. JEL0838]